VRIVTWNTWWQFGPWKARQPLLAAALAAQEPDVVLLQETWPGQAEALAAACGLEVIDCVTGPFRIKGWDRPADVPFGNAVLASPASAMAAGRLPLDSPGDVAPRAAVAASIDSGPDRPRLLVVSTHLSHRHDLGPVRRKQLDAIRDWVDELQPDGPVVLGGDLNQTPYSEEYQASLIPHWIDLWASTRPHDPGATMVPDNVHIEEVAWMDERNGPDRPIGVRFDYLLARSEPAGRPISSPLDMTIIGGADNGWPSDHLGVVADLDPAPPDPTPPEPA
jgi:endonuclease/exonuclease/phosphatase family metal-dependent hydrolase